MKQIIFIALFLLISCEENQSIETIKNPNVYSIGFGSCLTQERSMPIFNTIKAENYDLFLMLGDNVYGDSEREDLLEPERDESVKLFIATAAVNARWIPRHHRNHGIFGSPRKANLLDDDDEYLFLFLLYDELL